MDVTQVLLTVIPVLGSIVVSVLANRKSKEAEIRATEVEAKAASRADFAAVTGAYKTLFETAQVEIQSLRARVLLLEQYLLEAGESPPTP